MFRPIPPAVLAAMLAWSAAPPCPAQRAPNHAAPLAELLAEDAALHDVCFIDARRGWAAGDRGVVLRSEDGGRRWTRCQTPADAPLHAVSFADPQNGWALGGSATPYTHATRGVVLATTDGGATWEQLPAKMLPLARDARLLDARRGFAVGSGDDLSPSGVFETQDGGRHWGAAGMTTRCDWRAAAFPAHGEAALVGPGGAARLENGTVAPCVVAGGDASAARGVALGESGRGWLVGDRGLILATENAGRAWAPAETPPPAALKAIDFRAVAAHGKKVWAVGAPGSRVAHSPDGGKTWRLQPTGVTTPLHAIQFVDGQRGWAVGALGVVLATLDGGQSWRVERSGGARCAAVVVAPTPEDVPLEMVAKIAGGAGRRTAVLAMFTPDDPGAASAAHRLREATVACGASHAEVFAHAPLQRSHLTAGSEQLAAHLEERLGGDAQERFAAWLATRLAALRPNAVLIAPSERRGVDQLFESAVTSALNPPTGGSDALKEIGLSAHRPQRVLRVDYGEAGPIARLVTGDFDPQLGASPAQWTAPLRGLLAPSPCAAPEEIGWTTLAGTAPPPDAKGDPLAGIRMERGGPARRALATPPGGRLAALRAIAEKQQDIRELLASETGGAQWATRVLQLTGGLDADAGAPLLVDLAERYHRTGKPRLAADTYYLLARRYEDRPLSDPAVRWLIHYYSGTETAARAAQAAERESRGAPLANIPSGIQTPSDGDGPPPVLSLDEHLQRATKLGDYLETSHPRTFADPAVRFPLAAAHRRLGEEERAEQLVSAFARQGVSEAWRRCAWAERWVGETGRPAPKPLARVLRAAAPPHLDARLDDPCWRSPAELAGAVAAWPGAEARLAYDDEYLYLGARCDKLPGAAYPNDDSPRPRDADLSGYDRLVARFDADRDYTTSFALAVDCRGWTHDACWDDESWNPRWYVAAARQDGHWLVEAAIPLKDLAQTAPHAGDVWCLSLERQAPSRAPAPWTGAAHVDRTPDAFGLLLFE